MLKQSIWRAIAILVLTLLVLVHVAGWNAVTARSQVAQLRPSQAQPLMAISKKKSPKADKSANAPDALPRGVADMVDAILAAVRSGEIADLDDAVDWNEMKPDLGPHFVSNPVAYWKSISKDGQGRDILEILGKLLASKPAVVPFGRDIENNRLYIWPVFADTPLSKLATAELEALAALTTEDSLKVMRKADRYTGWRLVIGADGTWHTFKAE